MRKRWLVVLAVCGLFVASCSHEPVADDDALLYRICVRHKSSIQAMKDSPKWSKIPEEQREHWQNAYFEADATIRELDKKRPDLKEIEP